MIKYKAVKEVPFFLRENKIINGKLFIYTVQPDAPVNLTLETKTSASITNLWAKWSPPPIADVRSNSHVYHYELRLKTEEMEEWEVMGKYIYCVNALLMSCLV